MQVTFYFDYTCQYCFRAHNWLRMVREKTDDIELKWATFSLKEVNRDQNGPSVFEDKRISSLSVLALALSHAARQVDFDRYHNSVFEAMHSGERLKRADVLKLAADAGVDVHAFDKERERWLAEVEREHNEGVSRWSVFGTPTLVLGEDAGVWLKLTNVPTDHSDAAEMWRGLCTLSLLHPDLIEIKRSR
jgi:predicted DsbA family dithiol-disulfide isomerase